MNSTKNCRHGKIGVVADETDLVLDAVGPRLRALRKQRGMTLADLSTATGTSESTLSRLESGGRRPTLELLLPLARVYGVPLTTSSAPLERVTRGSTCSRSTATA